MERIGETLPGPVYALLSGLNAATVGIIALAAVQLSQKAITDKVTRILVFFGGAAGVLYNALWYFPVLMVVGGLTTIVWDYRWGHKAIAPVVNLFKKKRPERDVEAERQADNQPDAVELRDASQTGGASSRSAQDSSGLRRVGQNVSRESVHQDADATGTNAAEAAADMPVTDATEDVNSSGSGLATISWKIGIGLAAIFFAVFITLMVLRGTLKSPPRLFEIFANLFLAGTCLVIKPYQTGL